jgi:hypothetical protein
VIAVGLFTFLATLPLAPVRGVVWVAEQVADEAERQLYDEQAILRELLALELQFDDGLIGEEERAAREEELLERLAAARRFAAQTDQASADDRELLAAAVVPMGEEDNDG